MIQYVAKKGTYHFDYQMIHKLPFFANQFWIWAAGLSCAQPLLFLNSTWIWHHGCFFTKTICGIGFMNLLLCYGWPNAIQERTTDQRARMKCRDIHVTWYVRLLLMFNFPRVQRSPWSFDRNHIGCNFSAAWILIYITTQPMLEPNIW